MLRSKLPNVELTGRSESCGKENCQVCDFICDADTFSAKACDETFEIQSGVLNCTSQKVVYFLNVEYVGKLLMLVRQNKIQGKI